jgi:hypothetical protein
MADRMVFYPHRRNRDGSLDSICITCLVTVATGKSETELGELEKVHVCDPVFLGDRRGYIPPYARWSANMSSVPVSSHPGTARVCRVLEESERPPVHLLRILPDEDMTVTEMDAPTKAEKTKRRPTKPD